MVCARLYTQSIPGCTRFLLGFLALVRICDAHKSYLQALPNGELMEKYVHLHAIGHKSLEGKGQINWFGFDFAGHGYRWTNALCNLDSDSDGQSNGLELGDPGCSWTADGSSAPDSYFSQYNLSHPGDSKSTTTRKMPKELIGNVVFHTPTVPHSGIKSLMYVLCPLFVCCLVGIATTRLQRFRLSTCGQYLMHHRLGLPKESVGRNNTRELKYSSRASLCRAMQSECSCASWCADLLVGEALFLLAVLIGLVALVINKQWNGKYRVANTLGQVASTLCWLAILPVSRTSIWVYAFRIPFERAIKWHRLFGKLFILSTYMHLVLLVWRYGTTMLFSTIQWGPSKAAPYPYWGLVSGIATGLIAFTAFEAVRRNSFEIFYFVHVPMVQITAIAAIFHAPGEEYRYPVVIAVVFYAIDIAGRFLWRTHKVESVKVLDPNCSGALKLRIKLKTPMRTSSPGDYVFLKFPQISNFESHPFSISTVGPEARDYNFVIKGMGKGTFTNRLISFCGRSDIPELQVSVEGPYGQLSVRLKEYASIWICAGGIGAAPMVNVLTSLLHAVEAADAGGIPSFQRLEQVNFCWVVRRREDLKWYDIELQNLVERQKLQGKDSNCSTTFHLHLYVTDPHVDEKRKEDGICDDQMSDGERCMLGDTTLDGQSVELEMESIEAKECAFNFPPEHRGRPCYEKLFRSSDESVSKRRTALLVCGPAGLILDAQRAAMQVGWDVHKETFEF